MLALAVIGLFNVWVGLGVLGSQLLLFWLLLKYRAGGRLEGVWWGLIFSVLQWAFGRMRRIIQGTKNGLPVMGGFAFADRPEQFAEGDRVASRSRCSSACTSSPVDLRGGLTDLE